MATSLELKIIFEFLFSLILKVSSITLSVEAFPVEFFLDLKSVSICLLNFFLKISIYFGYPWI